MTVDRGVWPSVFQEHHLLRDSSGIVSQRPIMGITNAPPAEMLSELDLWQDAHEMRTWHREHAYSDAPLGVAIAVFVLLAASDASSEVFGVQCRRMPHGELEQWRLCGFDVADANLLSGLFNCGYNPDELHAVAAVWQNRLTNGGLIDDVDHAVEFKRATDVRVPEHAPFYVFGLASLECTEGPRSTDSD